ncbi:MAG: restriction endonuclease [Betaproteobacteria bacterium]|nr:restriction endonuclease [Betaproteobacteria bacterium]MDH5219632.1 restriction endonuclease [Betaproteobacteria bacterium]MDH5350020.1 restriction endonuclease [Betaproteobacteria bacterium]
MKLPENSLFGILMRARWWVSALVALAVFGLARLLLPEGLALFAALPFGVIACVVAWREIRRPRGARLDKALAALREMAWEEFADAVQSAYREAGFAVKRIDGAADFELEKSGQVTLLSARRWKAAVTGVEPLKELAAARDRRGAGECLYASAGGMTDKARAFCAEHKMKVVEGEELVQLVRSAR